MYFQVMDEGFKRDELVAGHLSRWVGLLGGGGWVSAYASVGPEGMLL